MQDIDAAANTSRTRLTSLGEVFPRLWGTFQAALLPANDAMLAFLNDALMPAIDEFGVFMDQVVAGVQPVLQFANAIAQKLEPMIELLRDGIAKLMVAMRPVVQFVEDNFTAVMIGLGTTIGILITAALVPLIATLWATATAAAAAALATAVALAPIIAVAAAIGVAVALLYTVWTQNWFGIQQVTETVLTELSAFIIATWTAIRTFFNETLPAIATNIITTWSNIRTSVQTTVDGISSNIITTWNNIRTSVQATVDGIWSNITTTWSNITNAVSNSATGAKDAVINQFSAMRDALAAGGTLAAQIGENAKAIGSNIVGKVQEAWQSLTGSDSLAGKFFSFVNNSMSAVKDSIATNGLQQTLINLAKELVIKVNSALTGLAESDSLFGYFFRAFSNVFNSLANISGTFLQNIQSFSQQMVTEIIKTFTASGTGIYQNLWNGIANAWSTLVDNVSNGVILQRLQNFAQQMVTEIIKTFTATNTGFYQNIWNGIVDAWTTLVNNVTSGGLFDALRNFTATMVETLRNQFAGDNATFGFYNRIWNAIVDGWNNLVRAIGGGLGDAIGNFATAMIDRIKRDFTWSSIGTWLTNLFTEWARTWFSGGRPSGASMVDGVSQSQTLGIGTMNTSSTTYNLTAQYGYQPERALRDDIRLLQLIQSTV